MGVGLSPLALIPSPPPPSSCSSSKSIMSMLYYGLAVVGTAAILLAIYNLKRCSRRRMQSQTATPNGLVNEAVTAASSRSFENSSSNRNLLSSFKYRKEAEAEAKGGVEGTEQQVGGDYECPVCLSVFEEGEEVRKLPRCKHSFHAICIDMWLYSHYDCPICRTPVGSSPCHRFPADINAPPENSRHGLLESGISV